MLFRTILYSYSKKKQPIRTLFPEYTAFWLGKLIWSSQYLSSLVVECFNRRLVFQWVRIVSLWARLPWLLKKKDRKLTHTFNSSFRYIYDVLSLNNSRFGDYLHLIYPNEPEVKDTTDTLLVNLTFTLKSKTNED